jgi:hypothetical protein
MLYYRAYRELSRIIDKTNFCFSVDVGFISYSASASMDKFGEWSIIISSAFTEKGWFNRLPFIDEFSHKFPYNGIINEGNFVKATKKEIEKYLFPKGFYQDVQLSKLWTKKQTFNIVKSWTKEPLRSYDQKEVLKWIEKHFNLRIGWDISFELFVKQVNKLGKQSTLKEVVKYDTGWFDSFDGDVDEVESAFYNDLDENYTKNQILI